MTYSATIPARPVAKIQALSTKLRPNFLFFFRVRFAIGGSADFEMMYSVIQFVCLMKLCQIGAISRRSSYQPRKKLRDSQHRILSRRRDPTIKSHNCPFLNFYGQNTIFDVGRLTFDVQCSFVSISIKPAVFQASSGVCMILRAAIRPPSPEGMTRQCKRRLQSRQLRRWAFFAGPIRASDALPAAIVYRLPGAKQEAISIQKPQNCQTG